MCMFVCRVGCVHVRVFACMWRSKVDVRSLLHLGRVSHLNPVLANLDNLDSQFVIVS